MHTESDQRHMVIAEAETWMHPHTPFIFGACVKGIGVACGPFLVASYATYAKDAGLTMPIPPRLPKDWHFHTKSEEFQNVVAQFCRPVDTPLIGDVVLFRLGSKKLKTRPFSHGAIVVQWPVDVIHSWYKVGVEHTDATRNPDLRNTDVSFWSPWGFVYPPKETK